MITTKKIIHCINPDCEQPINNIGDRQCQTCQTHLIYRYLWAVGIINNVEIGTSINNRYEVITEQIWLDTQPGKPPEMPEAIPQEVIPYLKLYREKLHIPQPYGLISTTENSALKILLLENAPIDNQGNLYPVITAVWEQAKGVRQIYWLWQILQLWQPLSEQGVSASLLSPYNILVQGWCIKLLELHHNTAPLTLQDLGESWYSWIKVAKAEIAPGLNHIIQQMRQGETDFNTISNQLNQLLLGSAAELPLMINIAGFTDPGLILKHNEDSCYPNNTDKLDEFLTQHLSIVCDGIDGHDGGEVASQLAVQSLKIQIRAWLQDISQQSEIIPPELLQQQLEASLRVVNNMIWSRNDEQNRQGRERMATTLVLAVQVPQRIITNTGWESDNTHELFIANVGDSRAYWITPHYCQLLTTDDDMATREVRSGQSFYRQADKKPNANALTQALGTREAEVLKFSVKRFILEEDGILLLCSDGLSDDEGVEKSWKDLVIPLLKGQIAVEDAAKDWVKRANEKNGQDNTSVVISVCRISQAYLVPVPPAALVLENNEPEESAITLSQPQPSELQTVEAENLTQSSQALLDLDLGENSETTVTKKPNQGKMLVILMGIFAFLLAGTGLGLIAWWQLQPQSFNQFCRQLPPELEQFCPNQE
ncbi:MAG: serine/threonine-protein phosphatase [Nostocales cyanobacterium]|nr:MAG: serine/threonine-protein phosphatase [Nostocales cyanobacterium]TAF09597.1 MAG: serine/threonine-protein phosphatase [Nostocales cyanobacterium]